MTDKVNSQLDYSGLIHFFENSIAQSFRNLNPVDPVCSLPTGRIPNVVLRGGLEVLQQQLRGTQPAIVVHVEAIGQMDLALSLAHGLTQAEADGLDALSHPGQARPQAQAQMPIPHQPPVEHLEDAIEKGLGEALAPGAGGAQRLRRLQIEAGRRQLPVGHQLAHRWPVAQLGVGRGSKGGREVV